MINLNNKNRLTKKNYNYIQTRLKTLKLLANTVRKDAKKLKSRDLELTGECLYDIWDDLFMEIYSIKYGGLE